MKLKVRPEDFRVDEVARFDPDPQGTHAVYRLRKRKLTTFDAVRRLAAHARVPVAKIRTIGLKDRQAVTTQLVSIEGASVRGRVPGLGLEPLGRSREPLGARNLLGNDFTVVVRDLSREEAEALPSRVAALERHGLVSYFDDQRFGSIRGGQGFLAKDLVFGRVEEAARKLLATPSRFDPPQEKKFKHLVSKLWGDWKTLARKFGSRRGVAMIRHLARKPRDFRGAFQRLPTKERAIHVFSYQSFAWNESVAWFLRETLPKERLREARTVAGTIVFHDYDALEDGPALPETFPLVSHLSTFEDPRIEHAVAAALAQEGLTLERFRIDGIPGCFFKHEERPLLLRPSRFRVTGGPVEDELHPGRFALTVSFGLPPGGYATLVLKRLLETRP